MAIAVITYAQEIDVLNTQYFETEGGRIAYDDTGGSGPLVIAIPGMGDLRAEYRHLRPVLHAAGYRVATMDIRGAGESSVQWADYSAKAVGRDALALLRHLGEERAFIFGNSFAAGAALWAAHDAPSQVAGVVLLGPIVRDAPPSALMDAAIKLGLPGLGAYGSGRPTGTACFLYASRTIIRLTARC
ncbi:MAG TPA: alpha/beta hydrolase [Gallionella sp.]|nr:alpha/beta hydrolase [Gallionella sp.]